MPIPASSFTNFPDTFRLFRKTYTAKNEASLPGELLLENDQTAVDEVARAAHEHMGIVYDYYKKNFRKGQL